MTVRTNVILLALLTCAASAHAGERAPGAILSACAAFATDGSSAAVTIRDADLSLEIVPPSSKVTHLNLTLFSRPAPRLPVPENLPRGWTEACEIFFDETGHSVAIGIRPTAVPPAYPGGPLEVAVADVRAQAWLGHFLVSASARFTPYQLAGFLRGGDKLVVAEQAITTDVTASEGELYASFLFSPTGEALSNAPTTVWRTPAQFSIDAHHNRLWILPCQWYSARFSEQPLCSISSMPLSGGEESDNLAFSPLGRASKREEIWMVPGAFVSPSADAILLAETIPIHEVDTIWRLDMRSQTMERLVLPCRVHFPSMEGAGSASLSPDDEVAAISFDQFTHKFPWLTEDMRWAGKHIALVRVRPLELLGIFPPGSAQRISAMAVDHRDGNIILLTLRRDRWERQELHTTASR